MKRTHEFDFERGAEGRRGRGIINRKRHVEQHFQTRHSNSDWNHRRSSGSQVLIEVLFCSTSSEASSSATADSSALSEPVEFFLCRRRSTRSILSAFDSCWPKFSSAGGFSAPLFSVSCLLSLSRSDLNPAIVVSYVLLKWGSGTYSFSNHSQINFRMIFANFEWFPNKKASKRKSVRNLFNIYLFIKL